MIFRIPKGWHHALPFRFWLWWKKDHFSWQVVFTPSCRYNFGNEDQYDQNKLCGIGYLPHHHKNSARFGWRYRPDLNQIELSAYCYIDGQRIIKSIAFVEFNKPYNIHISIGSGCYYFDVIAPHVREYESHGNVAVEHNLKRKLQYRLSVYFGGNRTSPGAMTINLKRI
jgi:hypothetical protein